MQLDMVAVGDAIVDSMAFCEEAFLREQEISKGAMHLIDAERAAFLYTKMHAPVESAGGSAANSAVVVANLGGRVAFMGKVADDPLGARFATSLHSAGVAYDTPALKDGPPTAQSLIFITPDGERSMNTYLGACLEFAPRDIDFSLIDTCKILYFEGYLWDPPNAKDALRQAAKAVRAKGRHVALSLSHSFCVDRYRSEFLELIQSGLVDIVFANREELLALYETADMSMALRLLQKQVVGFASVTDAEQGATIVDRTEIIKVDALPVNRVVDGTGAGDNYAAGFLYAYARGHALAHCGRLGAFCASYIIQQVGARPKVDLRALAKDAGLL
ncbi:adenosine kinase [Bartonella sp. DGB2]|uniref:adenosine kinase n=1 Tax=Bartonella sp. DGB2 TaxID=3388426 RepID=UPI00398FDEC9